MLFIFFQLCLLCFNFFHFQFVLFQPVFHLLNSQLHFFNFLLLNHYVREPLRLVLHGLLSLRALQLSLYLLYVRSQSKNIFFKLQLLIFKLVQLFGFVGVNCVKLVDVDLQKLFVGELLLEEGVLLLEFQLDLLLQVLALQSQQNIYFDV